MQAKRSKVISSKGNRTYLVRCERLWEEDASDWMSRLASRGAEVASVAKRLREGRGVLVVEFVEPVALSEARVLLEQDEEDIDAALDDAEDDAASAKGPAEVPVPDEQEGEKEDEDLFEGPETDHVYVLSKDLIARVKGEASADPVKLEGGTHVKFTGEDGERSFIFTVLNGADRGKLVVWSRKEWDSYEQFLSDQGDAKDSPELSNPKPQSTDEMDAPKSPKNRESEDSKVGSGMDAFMRVARSFPDFPARKSLEHYLTRAGQQLYNKPPPEPGEGGGGGGGGFGGF